MQYDAKTPDEYIAGLPEDRKLAISALRKVINENLPKGFKETMGYGHMGWVVPHETYPAGYHCDPTQPLPFMGIASQKNHIALYSMCLYGDVKHWIGFEPSGQNIQRKNSTWANRAFDSRSPKTSR